MAKRKLTSVAGAVINVVQARDRNDPIDAHVAAVIGELSRPSSEARAAVEFLIRDLLSRR